MIFEDQLNRTIKLGKNPARIVSLVPSQTELLIYLGKEEQIVGRTKFCIHPQHSISKIAIIGGTKKVHYNKITDLNPDLIIGNKEENNKKDIDYLEKRFPVWLSDVNDLSTAYDMIDRVSIMLDVQEAGSRLIDKLKLAFDSYSPSEKILKSTGVYVIWRNPIMVVGNNTFINDMLMKFGMKNAFADMERYPEIQPEVLAERNQDYIFLSSEPFPFREKHLQEFKSICPAAKVIIVDGELFSWYGNRLLKSVPYFEQLKAKM